MTSLDPFNMQGQGLLSTWRKERASLSSLGPERGRGRAEWEEGSPQLSPLLESRAQDEGGHSTDQKRQQGQNRIGCRGNARTSVPVHMCCCVIRHVPTHVYYMTDMSQHMYTMHDQTHTSTCMHYVARHAPEHVYCVTRHAPAHLYTV